MKQYQPVIGLEIHVELKTNAKMFCQCPADYFGKPPNSQTCPVCLGLPGALPVPNKKAIEFTHLIGRALNCHLNETSKFDRKHYFYPDLPKGYQISQYNEPIASRGWLKSKVQSQKSKVEEKEFRIRRVHLEEDTGKLIHRDNQTLIDFNRSGVPLVEIVTEPDFTSSDDVKQFLEELQILIRDLDVSDADMEKGSMRLEPNISLREIRNKFKILNSKYETNNLPNYKVEVKNINSFRFVKQAVDYEIKRQIELLQNGKTPKQETRGFDENKGTTYSQRTKEEAHDYRYFPEPDIPTLQFDQKYFQLIEDELKSKSTFDKRWVILIEKYKINQETALIIAQDKTKFQFFEECARLTDEKIARRLANVIVNKPQMMRGATPTDFAARVAAMYQAKPVDKDKLAQAIAKTLKENTKAVSDYQKGKQNALMFLVGQVMKEMKGQVNAQTVMSKIKAFIK